jgi:hypothetical protein
MMEYAEHDRGRISLFVTERELIALKGALLEADEAIRDDMAFSARVGATRHEVRRLFDEVIAALRLLPTSTESASPPA